MKSGNELPIENYEVHLDIQKDIDERRNGVVTFILRVHEGKITDYTLMEVVDVKSKYRVGFTAVSVEELIVSHTG